MSFYRLVRGLLDFLLPNRCIECHQPARTDSFTIPLCEDHRTSLAPLDSPVCYYCSRPLSGGLHRHYHYEVADEPVCGSCRKRALVLDRVVAGFPFDGVLRSVVQDWKYGANPEWSPWLAGCFHDSVRDRIDWSRWGVLVPVPMHPRRRQNRGFNQARQLAEGLGDRAEVPVLNVLSKVRRTRQQSELSRADRLENLRGAFTAEDGGSLSSVESVLIVDDIYTTGSTLRTAARALDTMDIADVGGLVLARTLPSNSA